MTTIAKLVDRSDMSIIFWAKSLMEEHGLISDGWKFRISGRTSRTLGTCRHSKKEICLSRQHATQDMYEQVLDTMLHEIAHALVGKMHGHGAAWQAMAIKVGAIPTATKNTTLLPVESDNEIPVVLLYHQGEHYFVQQITEKMFDKYHGGVKNINTTWVTGNKWTKGKLGIYKLKLSVASKLPKFEDIK